jgi:hypothetical protein
MLFLIIQQHRIVTQEKHMPTFPEFCRRAKMRHDYSDQIQVRYRHTDGEDYDTWVSGEEALQRLRSTAREEQLKGLSKLDWEMIRQARESLLGQGQQQAARHGRDRLGDVVEDFIGGNVIGDSLSDAVRGHSRPDDPHAAEREKWQTHLHDDAFYAQILELAFIQLAGSFPEDTSPPEPDDWL